MCYQIEYSGWAVNSFWLYFLCTIQYYNAGDGQSETLKSVGDVLFPLPYQRTILIGGGPEIKQSHHLYLESLQEDAYKHHFYIHYCLNKIGIKRIISMKHWYQNTGTHAWFERALRIKSWLPFSWSLHYYRLANPLEKLWRDNLHDQTSLTKCKFTTSTYIYN